MALSCALAATPARFVATPQATPARRTAVRVCAAKGDDKGVVRKGERALRASQPLRPASPASPWPMPGQGPDQAGKTAIPGIQEGHLGRQAAPRTSQRGRRYPQSPSAI